MSPAEHVIGKCGGPQRVAAWCGVDVSRVYRWTYSVERGGTGGHIPAKHQPIILAKARSAGIGLTADDFFDEAAA